MLNNPKLVPKKLMLAIKNFTILLHLNYILICHNCQTCKIGTQLAKYISLGFVWLLYTFDARVKLSIMKSYTTPPQLYASRASKLSKTLKGNE